MNIKAFTAGAIAFTAAGTLALIAPSFAASEVTLCHKSGNTFSELTVNLNAKDAHLAHGDVFPVPTRGCESLNPTPPTPTPTPPNPTPPPTPSPVPTLPKVAPVPAAIPSWMQQYGREQSQDCPIGWGKSWAQWPHEYRGGFVCSREIPKYGQI